MNNAPIQSQIALGTVQLGMPYGVANFTGRPNLDQAEEIILTAWRNGVRWFDTAQAYGDSESVLGYCFEKANLSGQVKVISKLHPDADIQSPKDIRHRVMDSLQRLRVPSLAGLLLHREEMLDGWPGILGQTLLEIKNEGLIGTIGASVYSAERALAALLRPEIDTLQVPANVFDRRMARAGVFRRAAENKKPIFVRSIYLQGLALLKADELPPRLSFARPAIGALSAFCQANKISAKHFALACVQKTAPDAIAVLGAETREQVEENCSLANLSMANVDFTQWDQLWPEDVPVLVNPLKWPAEAD